MNGPDMTTAEGRAGLTARLDRRRRDRMASTQAIGDSLREQGWTVSEGDEPGELVWTPPPDEKF